MGMQLPEWLRTMFLVSTGDGWPEANEDDLWALAREWMNVSDVIDTLEHQLVAPVRSVRRTDWDGPAAAAFEAAANAVRGQGNSALSGMTQGTRSLSKFIHETGVNVEYMKLIVIDQLLILAAQIAYLISIAPATGGASNAGIPALQATGRFFALAAVRQLAISIAAGEVIQVGLDAAVQLLQVALRTRNKWNTHLTSSAAITGVVGGVLAPGIGTLGNMAAKAVQPVLGKTLTEGLEDIAVNAVQESATSIGTGVGTGQGFISTPWDLTAGATEGAVDAGGRLLRRGRGGVGVPDGPSVFVDVPGEALEFDEVTHSFPFSHSTPADWPPPQSDANLVTRTSTDRPLATAPAEDTWTLTEQLVVRSQWMEAAPPPPLTEYVVPDVTHRVEVFEATSTADQHVGGATISGAVPGVPAQRRRGTVEDQAEPVVVSQTAVDPAMEATGRETPGPAGPSNSDAGSANSPDLDALWGDLAEPTKVHDRERDDQGDIRLNPLWYRLSDLPPGVVLSHRGGKWRYVVRADGAIYIGAEKLESMLSDDEWENLVGNMRLAKANRDLTVDELKAALRRQGHPTIAAGFTDTGTAVAAPARVGGALLWNPDTERWEVNDKSGRYMSTTARPGITEERALPWITNVAARLTEHLGVEIAPVPFRTPDAAAPPVGPQSATAPAAGAIA